MVALLNASLLPAKEVKLHTVIENTINYYSNDNRIKIHSLKIHSS